MSNINRIIGLCLYFVSSFVFACSCGYVSLEKQVSLSDNIFIVETNKIETTEQANEEEYLGGERRGYFKVLETLKGSSSGFTFIKSAEKPVCCICQSQVKNNTKYLVFNNGIDIYLSSCGFTKAISNPLETSDIVKSMIQVHKPTEIFSGVYIYETKAFLNDDGSKTKVLELKREDYFAKMSRISFEGIKLASGKIRVTSLNDERTLNEEEMKVIKEGKVQLDSH